MPRLVREKLCVYTWAIPSFVTYPLEMTKQQTTDDEYDKILVTIIKILTIQGPGFDRVQTDSLLKDCIPLSLEQPTQVLKEYHT